MDQSIAVADTRSPFAKALHILRNGGACPDPIIKELASLIAELARKHFGITSEVMVESARDAAVALISEGLILSTGSNPSNQLLADTLKKGGIRGAVGAVTKLIKGITSSGRESPTSVLFSFCNQCAKHGLKAGHAYLQQEESFSHQLAAFSRAKDWLLKNTIQGRILGRNRPEIIESFSPHDIVRLILLQYCGVKDNIESDFDFSQHEDNPDFGYLTVGPRLFKESKSRYRSLLTEMPLAIRLALEPSSGRSWFDDHVFLKSPEKTAKKTKAPKAKPRSVKKLVS